MICKKCNSNQIQIITKNSGQKLYHCKNCGYNFSNQELFNKNNGATNNIDYETFFYGFFSGIFKNQFIKKNTDPNLSFVLELFFNSFGFLISFVAISLFGFVVTSGLDFVVTNSKYGQIGALIAGFLLFLISPIIYVSFIKSLFDNREGIFSPHKIGFGKRFSYWFATCILGIFNLFLVGLMILFVPAATKDIINGPKIECLTFVKILDKKTNVGGNRIRIYKNYVQFKKQNGELKELSDLKLDYKKIKPETETCFDKFENLNIYAGDRLK